LFYIQFKEIGTPLLGPRGDK